MNKPAILAENEHSDARRAFLKFQSNLLWLEESMKPLLDKMSAECRFELQMVGVTARSFFKMANEEIFSQQKESVFNGK